MATRLDVVGMVVEDMGRAVEFYGELGLEFPDGAAEQGHVEVDLPGGLRFALDTVEEIHKFDPEWAAASGGANRMGFAFLAESPAEVDATYERLTSLGYEGEREPWDAFWGQRYASVKDPDGNGVDLFCPLS
ncbi:MAG TPA: VOC family protein [Solirubrobacterales bacterium]|nr:VOC family protein [Solirubrobacterales bacterium]